MTHKILTQPITGQAFAPFGDVIEAVGTPDKMINQGMCGRYHDRADLDFNGGRAGVSLFKATPRALPLTLEMVERHPDGAQTFIPMSQHGFLVIVAQDKDGVPDVPHAFLTNAGQAINFQRNIWHGVLTPLAAPGLFAVVDRIGPGANLEEHWFDTAYVVELDTETTGADRATAPQ